MVGNNSLVLCEAQMQIIVQEWLDRVTMPSVHSLVKSVTFNSSQHQFEVLLQEPPKDVAAPTGGKADG